MDIAASEVPVRDDLANLLGALPAGPEARHTWLYLAGTIETVLEARQVDSLEALVRRFPATTTSTWYAHIIAAAGNLQGFENVDAPRVDQLKQAGFTGGTVDETQAALGALPRYLGNLGPADDPPGGRTR